MLAAPPREPGRTATGGHHRRRVTAVLGLLVATVAGVLVGVVAPLAAAPTPARAATTTYGAPSWWQGDCDTTNWTKKARAAGWTGEAARRLGGVVLGIPVCGPRNLAGGPNIWWSRPGWGELEWQCVEFAQRFMIQVYGVEPYQANGVDVVNHYTTAQGGGLVKVTNGTVGKAPQPGDVMSFSSPTNSAGHVAVVATTTVNTSGNGTILLATQNDTADGWRTLTVTNWKVASFGSLYPYAWLHDPLNRGNGGVSGDTTVRDGSYVTYGGFTYRIAGGAPLVVSSWTAMGGVGTNIIALDAAGWANLRTVPRDGTFLRDAVGTSRWRVAGGVPLPVTDCAATGMGGCTGSVDIDALAVSRANLGGVFGHLRTTIADRTFLRIGDDGAVGLGTIGRAAGGAVLTVADCDDLGGCNDWVTVQRSTWIAYRSAHPTPVDGTVVRLQPSARYATFTGGRCAVTGGSPTAWTDIPDRAFACTSPLRVVSPTATLVRNRPVSTTVTATGGTAPYRYDVVAGKLPVGMTLASNGTVSGTPTTAAASALTLRVTDAAGATATSATTLTVAAVVAVTTTSVPAMTAGRPVGVVLQAVGGTGSYHWTAVDPLPAGLVVSSDGLLGGTPSAATTKVVRIRATDAGAPAYGATASFTVAVAAR